MFSLELKFSVRVQPGAKTKHEQLLTEVFSELSAANSTYGVSLRGCILLDFWDQQGPLPNEG